MQLDPTNLLDSLEEHMMKTEEALGSSFSAIRTGQLPDRGLHRAAPLKSSGQREIVKASHLGKQGHASDHKTFRIHPASHAPASKDYRFAVFVYHFSAVSVKEALHAVS